MSDTNANPVAFVRDTMLEEQAPPPSSVGVVGWMRENLFSGIFNSVLTVICGLAIVYVLAAFLPWLLSPTWNAGSLGECRGILAEMGREGHWSGACWGVIRDRWVQLLFGFYPSDLYWRPILALVLLLVALAPVLFSDHVPAKLFWFTAIYPFVMPWLLWGGAIWGPLLVLAGFVLAYVVFRLASSVTGTLVSMILAVAVAVLWFLFGISAVNDTINRVVGASRMDARAAELSESITGLQATVADYDARIKAQEAKVAETLEGLEAAQSEGGGAYRAIVDGEAIASRSELDTLRRKAGLAQIDLSSAATLQRQIAALPELEAELPALREEASAMRDALPDSVSDVTTEVGFKTLTERNQQDDLGIPSEDLAALSAVLEIESTILGKETTIGQTYAEAARVGLEPVQSRNFGGFMLSITIGVVAIACSLPLGIVLALGRQSDLLIVKYLCVGFIEFIRGVPLITLLFVASTLLNIFMPPGTNFDIILRVLIMVTLFAAAYMAEVIRGGLAALPTGQYEGADSLGLNYWQAQRLVIMPQALKISIPGIVSTFIGIFKDTVLVSIIALLDPLGLSTAIRADAAWNGIVWELYGFIALLFFVFCFSMSRYSMYLERRLQTGHR